MNIVDLAILKKMVAGGGGSGTDNYNDLSNLPQINGETLAGNKTAENLGLQDALTFDSEPTEDSTNPVASGGVYNALAGKQDNLTFDGVYNASTNKAATESTVTNAIAGLDVSALSVDADETISSISENDGKISVTKQDIAIASNQVVAMTGYTKPSSAPATPAIQQGDTANAAIGKLEYKADVNQTNILYSLNKVGKNDFNFPVWSEKCVIVNGTKEITNNSIKLTAMSADCFTNPIDYVYPVDARIPVSSGDKIVLSWTYTPHNSQTNDLVGIFGNGTYDSGKYITGSANEGTLEFTVPANVTYVTVRVGVTTSGNSATYSDLMVSKKTAYSADPTFEPYSLPNYDLTRLEQQDRNALVEVVDKGAKNKLKLDKDAIKSLNSGGSWSGYAYTPTTAPNLTVTINDDSTVTLNGSTSSSLVTVALERKASSGFQGYVLSGSTTNTKLVYQLAVSPYTVYATVDGAGSAVIANYTDGATIQLSLQIVANSTFSNTVITPMICTEADWKISQNYAPFALPNTDLTRMVNDLQKKAVKVYTYHVNPNESDPEDAVTYLDDATGLTPAKMGASSFSYGSWANAWFLPRPCMLKSDGTVAYYLNPNDYSKKTDGTASDIADVNFDGNVMLEFPKIWVKRVAGSASGERTVSIAPVNVDGTYKCWSNINAEDKEVDHFYLPAYNGTIHSSKMRSLSGVTLDTTYAPNYTRAQEVTAATANNPSGKNLWYTETWADFCLIYDLLYLMGKSLDVQRTFGQGLSSGSETAMRAYVTGTHNAKGLFYGDVSGTSTAVKVLGMENLWGCRWHGVAGLINDNGTLKVKMTYGVADGSTTVGYNTTGSGYLNYGSTYGTNGFVKKMQADNTMGYKIIETAGTDATYYCDYYYTNNSQSNYALLGGNSVFDASCGFSVSLNDGAANLYWSIGGSLSCRPES